MKKFLVVAMTVWAVAFALQGTRVEAAEKKSGDDVFADEGDGDFDAVPTVAQKQADDSTPDKSKKKKKKKGSKPKAAEAEKLAGPAPASVAANDAAPETPLDVAPLPDLGSDVPPEPIVEPVGEPAKTAPSTSAATAAAPVAPATPEPSAPVEEPAAPAAPKEKKSKVAKAAKAKKAAAGLFVVTKEACPMTREPASEAETMITVKAAKKIWVEEVDASWVRGFNKAGEPGYINRDCLK